MATGPLSNVAGWLNGSGSPRRDHELSVVVADRLERPRPRDPLVGPVILDRVLALAAALALCDHDLAGAHGRGGGGEHERRGGEGRAKVHQDPFCPAPGDEGSPSLAGDPACARRSYFPALCGIGFGPMDRLALQHEIGKGDAPEFLRGSDLLERAYAFAGGAHASQLRKGDDSPYIGHPVTVARLLEEAGQPEEVLAAALLHDVVEDTGTSQAEIEEVFGEEVCRLVDALSEDPSICEYEMRKRALRDRVEEAGPAAVAIYAADKLSNLRDMRTAFERDGAAAAERFPIDVRVRLALWRADLEMASRVAPELSMLRDLRYELEAFEEAWSSGAGASGA